jgi:hypothetical protein
MAKFVCDVLKKTGPNPGMQHIAPRVAALGATRHLTVAVRDGLPRASQDAQTIALSGAVKRAALNRVRLE